MKEPRFHYTIDIVNNLASIERLYGQLSSEDLRPSILLKLTQENQILATHYSTSIEGNPLSPQDVTNIILNDTIPVTKSEKEVKNYFSVLTTIFGLARKKEPLTTSLTLRLHKELMKGIDKESGVFRNSGVFVGHKTKTEIVIKHNPPFHTKAEIEKALEDLFAWVQDQGNLHPIICAGILHHQFVYIHPFFDGNGRLARILTTYFLLLKHYEVAKYFILDDYYDIDRTQYSDMLHKADNGDETKWLAYFLEGISHSLQAALARINELKNSSIDEITGEKRVLVTNREEEVLQILLEKKAIKTNDIQDQLQVTRQQAHQLLSSLVTKGLVKKFGITKSSYYKLVKTT